MNNLELNIPSSWSEISLEKFERIARISGDNVYEKLPQLLEVLTGVDEDIIKGLPATTLEQAGLGKKLEFLAEKPKRILPQEKIKLGGKSFKVHLYPAKWSAGQYLDYSTLLSQDCANKLAKIIACFCIPEGKTYGKGYEFDDVVDLISKNMSIEQVLGYTDFFRLTLQSYVEALERYLEKKSRKSTRKQEKRKRKNQTDSTRNGIRLYS